MKKALIIIFTGIIALACFSYRFFARSYCIQRIDSFSQVRDFLQKLDKGTLVLFDTSHTLTIPKSNLFRAKNIKKNSLWLKELDDTVFKNAPHPKEYYISIWRKQELPLLIEPEISSMIKSLQERGITVLVLTGLATGPDYTIASLPEWRFNVLKKLGIDFSTSSFPNMVFKELQGKDGYFPTLYNGILLTKSASKGALLGAFLNRINWKPNRVVFFDDHKEQIESVAQEMSKRGIPFCGFHYFGAEHVEGDLNKDIARQQLGYLVDHEIWLSEDEAQTMLNNTKNNDKNSMLSGANVGL
jgi:Protein of unknown function (DUF2608)